MRAFIGVFCLFAFLAVRAEAQSLCEINNGGCDKICSVDGGIVKCGCPIGFELNHDKKGCHSTDGCKIRNGGCEQICKSNHTAGTVKCSCKTGYEPKPNNKNACQYTNLCNINRGGCQHYCESVKGVAVQCSCRPGFKLEADGNNCYEVDKCAVKNGGCGQVCTTSADRKAVCSCNAGSIQDSTNPKNCIDITAYVPSVKAFLLAKNDECTLRTHKCSHTCTNTIESYECSCEAGWTLGNDRLTCEKWTWYWILIIVLIVIAVIIILLTICCLCGKFKWLAENICCKCFVSWKCCMTGLFCKCNQQPEADVTELYYHNVKIQVKPAAEAEPLTAGEKV